MVENERKDDNTGDSGGKSEKKLRVLLRTFGCQMNVRDSEIICGILQKAGYTIVDDQDEADVILFNTCSVRQHAEDKVWSEIGRLARAKKIGTVPKKRGQFLFFPRNDADKIRPIIGLIGCMAQNYGQGAFERAPDVDFVVGPQDIAKIPEIISKFTHHPSPITQRNLYETKIFETDSEARPEEIYHTGFYEDKEHAFVVISEGCSNFCSYCVVPYVRGALRNRGYKDILREIEEAVDKGITSITLLGQNVCAYGVENREQGTENKKGVDFIRLLEMVERIKGVKEFDFATSHPRDTSIELFKAMADLAKLKKYLHMPLQSGSDRILKLMNRGYTKKFYLDLADSYRRIVKGGSLTSDVILGFPSETEEDFKETYDVVSEVRFNAAYIFKYSARPHAESARFADDVPKEEKERRHRLILELQKNISKKVKGEN